jgi:opacity protein-like surface antigen
MRTIFRLLPAMAMLAALSAPGHAADLDQIIPAPALEDNYAPVEIGNGWYIRGDISYDLSTSTSGSYLTYDGVSYSTNPYDNFDLGAGGDVAFGAGYQFNSWLRADATLGYWQRDVNGADVGSGPCGIFGAPATAVGCRSVDTTKLKAWEVMANGYADLGTFVGVTPYLGAGLGMTQFSYGNLTNRSFCTDAAGLDVPGCSSVATHGSLGGNWRFTWALMAGASMDISKNVKFDLGYRYAHYSGGDMFGWDVFTARLGASGAQGSDNGFGQHQIKAGIRYALW